MVQAFIMIKTAAGESATVREQVVEMEAVLEAHVVAGQYDVIAEVQGGEVYEVIHAVATDLTSLDGVVDTRTYICLE
jgi:DNA-binding Lrp family transcriptional regulator